MNCKINLNFFVNTFFFSLIFILSFIYYAFGKCYDAIKFVFLLWYVIITINSIKKYGFFSVYSLFLLFSAFFIYDSLFFDLINYGIYDEFTVTYFPKKHCFNFDTGVLFLIYSSFFLFILDCTYYFFVNKKSIFPIHEKNLLENRRQQVGKIAFGILLITFPIVLYRALVISLYILQKGYLVVILEGIDESVFPSWTNGVSGIFLIAFYVVIICNPSRKIFLYSCIFYCINVFVKGLGGNRGAFLYDFFTIIVLYLSLYKTKKVNVRTILLLFIFCFSFAFLIGETREDTSENKEVVLRENFLFDFIAGQTNTRAIPFVIIENQIPYHNYPFIFSPIISGSGDNDKSRSSQIKNYNNINRLTLYSISPKAVYNGNGLGGAIIGEFIDCFGFFGVIFWTYILGIMIAFLDKIKYVNSFLLPFICIMMQNMFHNPRGYFFSFLSNFKYCFVALLLFMIIDIFVKYFYGVKRNV